MELSDLDRKQNNEQKKIEKRAVADWEVEYARAKLQLKDRHYKVSGEREDNYNDSTSYNNSSIYDKSSTGVVAAVTTSPFITSYYIPIYN